MSEIYNLSTLCRCCHADGDFKRLDVVFTYKNRNEVYENLLQEALGIKMSCPSPEVSYTICDECIMDLRNASRFRRQVLDCEQKFYEYCQNEQVGVSAVTLIKVEAGDDLEMDSRNDDSVMKLEMNVDFDSEIHDAPYDDDESMSVKKEEENKNCVFKSISSKTESSKTKSKQKKPLKPRKALEVVVKTEDGEIYACKECGGSYSSKTDFKQHILLNHKPTYKCESCNEEFAKKSLFNKHVKTHETVLPQCQYCGKTSKSIYIMKQHILHQHSGEKKSYRCDVCNKVFGFKNSLARHMLEHSGMKRKFMCDTCGLQANDVTNLKIHIMTVHQKIKQFQCHLCDKKFARNRLLKLHVMRHNGIKPFQCKMCPERFVNEDQKRRHLDVVHYGRDKTKIYKCVVCEMVLEDRFKLQRHLRTHKGFLPHKCAACDKDFVSRYSYNRHVLIAHTPGVDTKPFSCEICHQKFSTKHVLIRHKQSIHDPNRPSKVKVKCDLCKQNVYDLESHIKTHTIRPFSCNYCGKTYPTKSALNRHVKDHLRTDTFQCNMCPKVYKKSSGLQRHKMKAHKIVPKQENAECWPVVID